MKSELRTIRMSFVPGLIFVLILSLVKYFEIRTGMELAGYGLVPRNVDSLFHLLTFPLIHDDAAHLYSNILPLFILMAMLFFFYREVAWRVFILTWILHAVWLWIGGRPAFHIGASGIVYGLSSFLFFSGVWRRERKMMAVSLTVVFLYGGMVWGLFPFFIGTSWEAHLFGALAGLVLSWAYRHAGPQRASYSWETEPDMDVPPEEQYWNLPAEPASESSDTAPASLDPFTINKPIIRYDYIQPDTHPESAAQDNHNEQKDEEN